MRHLFALLTTLLMMSLLPTLATAGTLEEIAERGTVRLGFRESEPPMSFLDKDQKAIGYSIDLCMRIVNEVKTALDKPEISAEFVPVTATSRFQAIQDGSIDILCGSTTKTLARSELVDFTQLTFVTGTAMLSLEGSPVNSIADIQGKKVAVVKDTTTIEALSKAMKDAVSSAEIVPVATAAEGMKALLSKEVDAYSSDQVVLIGLVLTHSGDEKFVISQELISFEPFALAVRRDDSDFRLVANRVLSQLYRSGQIIPIYKKWFGPFSDEVPDLVEAMYILNAVPE